MRKGTATILAGALALAGAGPAGARERVRVGLHASDPAQAKQMLDLLRPLDEGTRSLLLSWCAGRWWTSEDDADPELRGLFAKAESLLGGKLTLKDRADAESLVEKAKAQRRSVANEGGDGVGGPNLFASQDVWDALAGWHPTERHRKGKTPPCAGRDGGVVLGSPECRGRLERLERRDPGPLQALLALEALLFGGLPPRCPGLRPTKDGEGPSEVQLLRCLAEEGPGAGDVAEWLEDDGPALLLTPAGVDIPALPKGLSWAELSPAPSFGRLVLLWRDEQAAPAMKHVLARLLRSPKHFFSPGWLRAEPLDIPAPHLRRLLRPRPDLDTTRRVLASLGLLLPCRWAEGEEAVVEGGGGCRLQWPEASRWPWDPPAFLGDNGGVRHQVVFHGSGEPAGTESLPREDGGRVRVVLSPLTIERDGERLSTEVGGRLTVEVPVRHRRGPVHWLVAWLLGLAALGTLGVFLPVLLRPGRWDGGLDELESGDAFVRRAVLRKHGGNAILALSSVLGAVVLVVWWSLG